MRLGTRLTVYYVSAIAVVLAGFSVALHAMAAKHLLRQADERLEAALNTLTAAAEFEPNGLIWEPEERRLTFGRRTIEGQLSWRVSDGQGGRIDGSAAGEVDRVLGRLGGPSAPPRRFASYTDASGVPWRMASRRLDHPGLRGDTPARAARPPGPHDALTLAAGTSLKGVRSDLRNLALTLGGLSLAVWTLALVTGWKLSRMALRPVTEMAAAARAIEGYARGGRLPVHEADDELGELGHSFNALLDRLGESMERQQRFTGDASHQLRTPLTSLQGHVDLALRQERPPEEYRRVLSLVQAKTRDLRRIVEGLMFLSRADAEARRPALEEVELDAWLREHLDAWPGPRRSDIVYEPDAAASHRVLVHPPLLGELLNNLLDNAAKYSPPDTPIRVRLSRHDDGVAFSVSDLGQGIDPADLPHVFEPFFRTQAARLRGSQGVGLGLSVAARIADAIGGRLTAESTPGRGAVFTVQLSERKSPGPEHASRASGTHTAVPTR